MAKGLYLYMKELVDPRDVERALVVLAIAGPIAGAIVGLLWSAGRKRALRFVLSGALCGAVLTLVYGMWRMYGLITDSLGLDSVANLGLQLVLFAVLGCVLGLVISKVTLFLKRLGREV